MALGNLTHMSYMRSHPGTIFDLDILEAAKHLSQKTKALPSLKVYSQVGPTYPRFDQHFPTSTLAHYLKKLQIKQTLFFIHRASTTAFIHTGSHLIFIDTHSHNTGSDGAVVAAVSIHHIDDLITWFHTIVDGTMYGSCTTVSFS